MLPIGSLVNVSAIIFGGTFGTLLGKRIAESLQKTVLSGLGLCVLVFGFKLAFNGELLIMIGSMVIGGIIGELLHLDVRINALGDFLKTRLKSSNPNFVEGFVAATMIFCVGSMAILGPLEEAIEGKRTLLYTKSILDLFTSSMLAARYGLGVVMSFIPLFFYQLIIFYLASQIVFLLPPFVLTQLMAVGGVMILGIALMVTDIKKLPIANFLPALIVVVVIANLINS